MDFDHLFRNKAQDDALAEVINEYIKRKPWVIWVVAGVEVAAMVALFLLLS